MIGLLLKKQLMEIFQFCFVDKKHGKAHTKTRTTVYISLMVGLFLILAMTFFGFSISLGDYLLGEGNDWLYFSMTSLVAIALGLFGSVFSTYATVYLPKDNDFLMSLPIPTGLLLISRITGVYVLSLIYSAVVWVPSAVAYWILVPAKALNVILPILMTFVLALIVTILSCILGWGVALIAKRLKNKSYFKTIFAVLFLCAYYVVYFRIMNNLEAFMAQFADFGLSMQTKLKFTCLVGMASEGSLLSFAGVFLITAAAAFICYFLMERTFLRLVRTETHTKGKKVSADGYKASSVRKALVMREMRHFTSISTWMLNGGTGILVLIAAAVAVLVKGETLRGAIETVRTELPTASALVPVVIAAFVGFVNAADQMTSVSISLEGKNRWIVQSMPLEPWTVLSAKEEMALLLTVPPVVLFTVAAGIAMRLKVWVILIVLAANIANTWFLQDFGLMVNLKHPDFLWTSEGTVCKNSSSVVITMFAAMGISLGVAAVAAGPALLGGSALGSGFIAIVFGILTFFERRSLKKKGNAVFSFL